MAGAYLEIPLGRDYFFTSNVASRLTEINANLNGATLYFLAKSDVYLDTDGEAIINVTPVANISTNIITVTIPRVNTTYPNAYPRMFWEISMLTANTNLYYNLDQGRIALVQPVRDTAGA